MLKIGLMGAGSMGHTHNSCYKALAQTHGLQVAALADARQDKRDELAAGWEGVRTYERWQDLLAAETLDIVDVCLPTPQHTECAIMAMEKGCDVFIEKPLCLSTRECDALLAAEAKTGRRVMVGHVIRFFPEYLYCKQVHEEGRFGRLQSLVLQRLSGRVGGAWQEWFRDAAASGSAIVDLHIHDADFARWLLGEPKDFTLTARNRGDLFEQLFVSYDFGGPMVQAEAVWDYAPSFPFEMGFRAHFDEATLVYNSTRQPPLVEYHRDGRVVTPDLPADDTHGAPVGYYQQMRYFAECVAAGAPIEKGTLASAVKTIRLVLAELERARAQAGL